MAHRTLRQAIRREIAGADDNNGSGLASHHPGGHSAADKVRRQVSLALSLGKRGRRADAVDHLARLRRLYPKQATVWLESATMLDRLGREAEAIPLYERAIELGLEGTNFRDALVCLASSLRSVGRVEKAVQYLQRAQKLFPRDVVSKLFLALCYHDLGRTTNALQLVALTCLNESSNRDLAAYKGALGRKYHSLGRLLDGKKK